MESIQKQKKYNFAQWIFLFIGIALFLSIFINQDIRKIQKQLLQVDYFWLFPVLLVSFLGNMIRALRWQTLLKPLSKTKYSHILTSLLFGYFVNLAFPRLGEISRSLVLSRRSPLSFESIFGTVITERSIDILTLLFLSLGVLWFYAELLQTFFLKNIVFPLKELFFQKLASTFSKTTLASLLIVFLLIFFIALFLLYQKISKPLKTKVLQFIQGLKAGLLSIFYMKNILAFLFYTFLIWIGYFLMTYLWFFALPETSHLSFSVGLILTVIGSWGKSLPIQGGGTGAYHFLVSQGFLLFAISEEIGLVMALVIHTTQIIFSFTAGALAMLWLGFNKS